jgi:hypothetical protein
MSAVPAAGLPKMMSTVSRRVRLAVWAAAAPSRLGTERIEEAVPAQTQPEQQRGVRGIVQVDPIGQAAGQCLGNVGSECTANDSESVGLRVDGHDCLLSQGFGGGRYLVRKARGAGDAAHPGGTVIGLSRRGPQAIAHLPEHHSQATPWSFSTISSIGVPSTARMTWMLPRVALE